MKAPKNAIRRLDRTYYPRYKLPEGVKLPAFCKKCGMAYPFPAVVEEYDKIRNIIPYDCIHSIQEHRGRLRTLRRISAIAIISRRKTIKIVPLDELVSKLESIPLVFDNI